MIAVQTVLRTEYRDIMRSIPLQQSQRQNRSGINGKNNTLLMNSYMQASNKNFLSQIQLSDAFFPTKIVDYRNS